MRKRQFGQLAVLAILTTGCTSYQSCCNKEDVVYETYEHRYGVPLSPDDWTARGQDGRVVTTRKDGVVEVKTYDKGVLDGETTYTFPHREIIQKREMYRQGQLVQETYNRPSGSPQRQVTYNSSPSNYTVINWYESGVPQCKEEYADGSLTHGEYYTLNNHLESAVEGSNGRRCRRDDFGQLLSVDEIENGQMTTRTTYYANGAPESVSPYINGVVQGDCRTYYPGGEPKTVEKWTNGKQEGITIVFENGEKVAEVPYKNGQRQGIEKRFRGEDLLVEEVTWVDNQRTGPSYSYVGDATKTDWYFQDAQVTKRVYDVLRNQ